MLVTIGVRTLLIPVGVSLARAENARRRLAPRLADLQKRWAKNPERLQRETLALYAAEKVSPFAGILPVLAQAPVLTLVYALFASPQIAGAPNALLDGVLLGAQLGGHLLSPAGLVFAGLLLALAVVAYFARRAALRVAPPASGIARVLSWTPFISVAIAAFLPLAAALYLAVSSAWSLGERAILRRVVAMA